MASTISADSGLVSGIAGIKYTSDSSGVLALQTGNNTTALTVDTSGNALLGTTTGFTSTTSGGQFVTGGVGIYPWVNGSSGATNTTNYTGNVYQNPTVFASTGASAQPLFGIVSNPQISNTGASGAGQSLAYGIYTYPYISSSGTSAYIAIRGIFTGAVRSSATDTSTYTSNFLQGISASASHGPTLASTAYTASIRAIQAAPSIQSGSASELS